MCVREAPDALQSASTHAVPHQAAHICANTFGMAICDLRRGKEAARKIWGNQASVLVGDFLLGRAFKMMVEVGSLKALDILSTSACVIAEGEVLQLATTKDTRTTERLGTSPIPSGGKNEGDTGPLDTCLENGLSEAVRAYTGT